MIKFYLILLLDVLVLQWFRMLIGFVANFLWHPPAADVPVAHLTKVQLHAAAQERYRLLNKDVYGRGGDSAKFLGMLSYATRCPIDWENVMKLVCSNGDLRRNLKEPYDEDTEFSTDMLAGFMLAVARRVSSLTGNAREKLIRVWDKTTWEGFPMLVSTDGIGKKPFGRGHAWRFWWILGSEEILMALAWLYLGYKVTGKKRYVVAYWIMMTLQFPSIVLACSDAQIFIGNWYGLSAHNTHSRVLVFHTGYMLSGSRWFVRALKKAYKRHASYCADIRILAGPHSGEEYKELAFAMLCEATNKGIDPCPQDKQYVSLFWPPEKVMRSSTFVTPVRRGADYLWERNPLKGDVVSDKYRYTMGLDVIFGTYLLERAE